MKETAIRCADNKWKLAAIGFADALSRACFSTARISWLVGSGTGLGFDDVGLGGLVFIGKGNLRVVGVKVCGNCAVGSEQISGELEATAGPGDHTGELASHARRSL
jgi:hypothetical protein